MLKVMIEIDGRKTKLQDPTKGIHSTIMEIVDTTMDVLQAYGIILDPELLRDHYATMCDDSEEEVEGVK